MGKIRGTHSSPGVYTKFTDLQIAANTLGITTLGLVGETLKGPAFQPIMINDYNQYKNYFGGTSAEKYKGSQYPRYELPYIAKSYLSVSDQLYVCRVLGLSGYNAGPAWVITANGKSGKKYAVAVIRSRGIYREYANIGTICNPINKYDQIEFDCENIELLPYINSSMIINRCELPSSTIGDDGFEVSILNLGKFTIKATLKDGSVKEYPVSLNSGAKDYIYTVLGGDALDGEAPIFVEELYDYNLQDLISNGIVTGITQDVISYYDRTIEAITDPVEDFVTPKSSLKRCIGKTYLCDQDISSSGITITEAEENGFTYLKDESGTLVTTKMQLGGVYVVKEYTEHATGKKIPAYFAVMVEGDESGTTIEAVLKESKENSKEKLYACKVLSTDMFVVRYENTNNLTLVKDSFSDYHESYRCASTPWIVSEVKGGLTKENDKEKMVLSVKKLFRFHTITDGKFANQEIKISVTNIKPDAKTFDIQIRDYNDSDASPIILESYRNLSMVKGERNFIGYQIGTIDGEFETKSKYVLVEVITNDMTETCVPAGFLGYPTRTYGDVNAPTFTYNTNVVENIRDKKQYFGLSDITGVDVDMLLYKGKNAYTEDYSQGYTKHFHLDSTLSAEVINTLKPTTGTTVEIYIDDVKSSEDSWETVNYRNLTDFGTKAPIIASEEEMIGTIYENINLRKFTLYPFGGFDGWDIYRTARTTSDIFKANKYKGSIRNGYGSTFSRLDNTTALGLTGNCITSDYYAFLAGAKQFQIPEQYVINLFATPGIDYVNDNLLTQEIVDMIEEERKDTFYVMTTPDKPFGNSDAVEDMYSSAEVADNLEDSGIDTYYASTYYPWVKVEDKENNIFINLPVTKDVLRNMADVDNKKFPWYAPAGLERGNVECKKMHFFARLEDEDNLYDNRINPVKTFSKDGVKIWGHKTMYSQDTPMNRINVVRLMLYMRKLITEASLKLIFDPNDVTLKKQFDDILSAILKQIKSDRGITDFKLDIQQTPEMMDAHELQCKLAVKPSPTLEYIEIEFFVTPQGTEFNF